MDRISQINDFFSPQKYVEICEANFSKLAEQITVNIQTKTSNSGAQVNALGLPEYTTGQTSESLKTVYEQTDNGFEVSFVGRHNIKNIDKGSSPADVQEEFGSFSSFLNAIEHWANAKEARYGLKQGAINPYVVANRVWNLGSILYREGGGTEVMEDLLQPVIDNINQQITEELDNGIYKWLDATIEI